MPDVRRTIDAVWKLEAAKIVGGLARLVHDVGLAEELAQDALVAALEQWPEAGIPDNPGAWLTTVARRRAVDHIRREQRTSEIKGDFAYAESPEPQDDVLRLMFVCCHPALGREARVALTLRLVAGLSAAEIARAFLLDEPRVVRRIAAAKQTLADEGVDFASQQSPGRLDSVLEVLYLVFNEGYSASAGQDLIRADLCREALRLGRMLAELAPGEAEAHGLVALMELQASRSAARTSPSGELILLHEQNRGRWDQLLIRRGFAAMLRARALGTAPGPYVLQAAIAVCHAQAASAAETDWARIAKLYDALVQLLPTPVVRLNRAVAIGMAFGPAAGLAEADVLLTDTSLRDYHLLPAVRGDLLARLSRQAEARREFERALTLTRNETERKFLRRRADEMSDSPAGEELGVSSVAGDAFGGASAGNPLGVSSVVGDAVSDSFAAGDTLGAAVSAFLSRDDLDTATLRSYRQTFTRLRRALGDSFPLGELTAGRVAEVCTTAWGSAAPKTWNRHRSTLRSFAAWTSRPGLAAELDRRPEPVTAATPVDLTAFLASSRHSLRERTLWWLLHESSATVTAVLALNVEDLDLPDRRARVGGRWVTWRSGAARLLPELVAGRPSGPLFLTDRKPGPGARADRCPHTGRARLSYERAEYLFKQATRDLHPAGEGYTLRSLRGSG
jgi:RNA polymerase sigma factor (sigma-70 family)